MEAPEVFINGYYGAGASNFSSEKQKGAEHFTIDDLLDFSNELDAAVSDGFLENTGGSSNDSSTITVVDSCNSSVSGSDNHFFGSFGSRSFGDCHFSSDLSVPYDDMAELEWLSNFVEDSFTITTEEKDPQALSFLSGGGGATKSKSYSSERTSSSRTLPSLPPETSKHPPFFHQETAVPAKARSKRSRVPHCDWSTRLLHVLTPEEPKSPKMPSSTRRESSNNSDSSGRKCLHCASEKTPQWRTGPMGPKTLCNACGVRYKSGRLVPEYRPASSPTFVSTKHSNSHRKVLELRRQQELQRVQQHQQYLSQNSNIFSASNGCDEYLIHQRNGHDHTHMI